MEPMNETDAALVVAYKAYIEASRIYMETPSLKTGSTLMRARAAWNTLAKARDQEILATTNDL